MKRTNMSKVTGVLVAAAMAGSSLFASPAAVQSYTATSQTENQKSAGDAAQLLKEIQSTADDLRSEAWRLESFMRSKLSWESHADQLTLTKDRVNAIGERLLQLMAMRDTTAPWQRQAIDSVVPVAVTLASSTEAAIEYLNENRHRLWMEEYTDHVKTIADRADALKDSVDLHLNLADTQAKLEELRTKVSALGS